ncbi:MAG: hypothetical protein GX230_09680 [Lentisphaerae bacterium]|nr:hypothetical protein [Lentisphaerota bacterium]
MTVSVFDKLTPATFCAVLLAVSMCAAEGLAERQSIDDAWLKEYLAGEFTAIDGYDRGNTIGLQKVAGVSDVQLRRVLLEIYAEAEAAHGQAKDQYERMVSALRRENAICELSTCADSETKGFLLDIAADVTKDGFLRTIAVESFLRVANAQEAKDALMRFLGSDGKGIDPLSVYAHARAIYDKADPDDSADAAKRRAIIAALMVAAANESGKIGFVEVDRILAMRSDAYRNSHERLALLERHSLEPPTKNLYTDADLQRALAEMRRLKRYTSVNTNAALLLAHDFTSSRTADNDDMWGGKLVTPSPEVTFAPRGLPLDNSPTFLRQKWFWLVCSGGFIILLVGGAFMYCKRQK